MDKEFEPDPVWYGTATLTPNRPIVAGEIGTWTITYTVGRYGVDNGGRLKLARRLASDWALPQFADSEAPNFVTATTTGDARISLTYEHKGHIRPWFGTLTLHVYDGTLREGDEVTIKLGDTSGGSPGTRAQTFRESQFEFLLLVESFETGIFVRVPGSLQVPIVGGRPDRLVVVAPTQVVAGERFRVTVKAEDTWGNPSQDYRGTVSFGADALGGLPAEYAFVESDQGVHAFEAVSAEGSGLTRIEAADQAHGLQARSNPVVVETESPVYRPFWADLHGQTNSTVGTGTVEEYFTFARDVAAVDVCTHQGNDFQLTRADWAEIQEHTEKFHEPGRFVTFLGYEWSGNRSAGGDHNVIWFEDNQPIYRSSHWEVPDRSDEHMDRYPLSELYRTLRGRKALIIPHIGGRRANLDYHDPSLEPVIEICSVHGRFEWFLHEAFDRGLTVGVVANGDDHTGRPGAAYATSSDFGVRGGLTCLLASELTREAVWEALRSRRTYATTGERIHLDVRSGTHYMGEEFTVSAPPTFDVRVVGTAPLYSVELLRGTRPVYEHPLVPREALASDALRLAWSGARISGRGRHTTWDGTLHVEGARFAAAEEFAFDNQRQGIVHCSPSELSWCSSTSGDLDGLIIRLEPGGEHAVFLFEAEPCTFEFTLEEVRRGPLVQDAGGLEQKVHVSLARNQPGPCSTCFSFQDTEAMPGRQPYYVRAVQEDGEMAWSSPFYIDYEPEQ